MRALRQDEVIRKTVSVKKWITATELRDFLNRYFKVKQSGNPFTSQDVQQYIKVGHLPRYLGNYNITPAKAVYKMYHLTQEKLTKKI